MKRAALAAAAVVLLLELALRAIGYAAPQWYQLDRQLGWQLHPHRHGWTIAGGGSCRELQRCGFQPDKLLEVLNFGVGGYGTAQEYVLLEAKAIRYQPDLVLLQFSPGDVMDNSPELAARIDDSFATAPSFDSRMQTRYRLAEEIADHSRSWQLARQMAELAFVGEAHAGGDLAVLHVMARMNSFTLRNGAELALVAIPHPRQAGQGMGYADQRLTAFGKQSGIAVLTLADALKRESYRSSGHWTPEAHRIAAESVAQRLCRATAQAG